MLRYRETGHVSGPVLAWSKSDRTSALRWPHTWQSDLGKIEGSYLVISRQFVVKACRPTVHRDPVHLTACRDPRVHNEVAALGGVCQDGGRQHDARMIAFAYRCRRHA